MPTHAVFLCLIYPIVGLLLARLTLGYEVLPLLFPLAAGFTLLGPFAAIGLYELSRRREQGLDASWQDAFDVLRSPSRGAIAALGLLLLAIFVIWIAVAQAIYIANFGYEPAASIPDFLHQVFTTPAGRMLIIVGNLVGFLFALAVLTISVVSFPLLLDRDVGAVEAVLTSVRVVAANPVMMAIWGLIVAGLLVIGSLPFSSVGRGGAGTRAFDLAPLSQGSGAGSEPSPSASASAEKPSLCGAISGRPVHRRARQAPGRGRGTLQAKIAEAGKSRASCRLPRKAPREGRSIACFSGSSGNVRDRRRQLTDVRHRLRQCAALLQLVADRPQRSARRAHLHRDAGIGIEHRRGHPGEIRMRECFGQDASASRRALCWPRPRPVKA